MVCSFFYTGLCCTWINFIIGIMMFMGGRGIFEAWKGGRGGKMERGGGSRSRSRVV